MKTAGSPSPRKMVVFVILKRANKAKGVQQSWLILKGHFLKACGESISIWGKTSKGDRTPEWMNIDRVLYTLITFKC